MTGTSGFSAGRRALGRLLPGPQPGKIFAIGENKTGTTSLHKIFQGMGYRSYHGIKWRDTTRTMIFRLYDCFTDGPPDDFRKLDRVFPGSKFILQVRDLDAWIDSRLEHINRLPSKKKRHPLWSAKESSIRVWVRRRNTYHLDVLSHFRDRPDDLLVTNYIREPDAAGKIATFLGHPPPDEKPHANRNVNAAKTLTNPDLIAQALTGLGIPQDQWRNDIYCPALDPDAWEDGMRADNAQAANGN